MDLPVVKKITRRTTHPSNGMVSVKYHPLTSGQQIEILTLKGFYQKAYNEGTVTVKDEIEFLHSLKDIILPSFPSLKSEDITKGDLEWFILELRRNSISSIIELEAVCPKCGMPNKIDFDITSMNLKDSEITKEFTLENDSDITLVMGHLSIDDIYNDSISDEDKRLDVLVGSLKLIKTPTVDIDPKDQDPQKLKEWFHKSVMATDQEKIANFLMAEPGIEPMKIEVDSCGNWVTTPEISAEKNVPQRITHTVYMNNYGKESDELHNYLDTNDYTKCGHSYKVEVDEFLGFFI